MVEEKCQNILYGVGSGCFEAPSDYVWMNYIDHQNPMMYPGGGYNGMSNYYNDG